MKYHILHVFITSTPFEEKFSDDFKGLDKLKLLTNFHVNLTSLLGGVTNSTFATLFITPRRNEVRMKAKFVRNFSLRKSLNDQRIFLE